ncbi:MAG TPA: tetrahydrofolate dehydrogenase/cyclohydrolase catalytic domain-containing protein, partial [Anaeromyxobacter sp.]|nr:tetrahydrofolate dehydrogenase/cyclohydrolase catalytic domain-containing protein [Anaeromyxobacter sp.]
MIVIDGKAVAAKVRAEVAEQVRALRAKGIVTGLTVVRVGEDPASAIYVRGKRKDCDEVGIVSTEHHLPAETSQAELLALVEKLNRDPSVHGILVQLPLPDHVDEQLVLNAISPAKDADGFHPFNVGALSIGIRDVPRPCTPAGVIRLLDEAKVDLEGKRALVVGRSNIVGKPMAAMLLERHATVTVAHSRTVNLAEEVARAEVLVAAIGRPELVRGAWIRPGAAVVDVGMNRLADGRL